MSPTPHGWLPPRLASRTGAAHQRRGQPCQDACGWWRCRDRQGAVAQVLVVSDGHGGARYHRSDAGSLLACRVALQEAARGLAKAASADPTAAGSGAVDWHDWLARELPARIVAAWRQAVLEHLGQHPPGPAPDGQTWPGDALQTYGATLGVLLLTPRWWGHTGLGDWDLVRLRGPDDAGVRGRAELLSEEPPHAGGGEATFSLCLESAAQRFAPRSRLHRLDPAQGPFQLLLCTDGIRKSCGSDADFLTLAGHLMALPASLGPREDPSLAEALDHISREGSGDDVSAVMASWGAGADVIEAARSEEETGPLIIQPPPPLAGQAQAPSPGLPPERLSGQGPAGRRSAEEEAARGVDRSDQVGTGATGSDVAGTRAAALALLVLAAGGGALLSWRLRAGPFAAAPGQPLLTAEQHGAIRRQVEVLCGSEGNSSADQSDRRSQRIRATLNQRRSSLTALASMTPAGLAAEQAKLPGRDPLTALITLSRLAPAALSTVGPLTPTDGTTQTAAAAGSATAGGPAAGDTATGGTAADPETAAASEAIAGLPLCAELQRELRALWEGKRARQP